MKVWDYLFPRDYDVIIWGAGKNGKDWCSFLQTIGRDVNCFFDLNADTIKHACGVEVKPPQACVSNRVILLISPDKHAAEIAASAKHLGYENVAFGNILKFIPRYKDLDSDPGFPYFGHFYSLYPDFYDVDERYEAVLSMSVSQDGKDAIRMNAERQCALLTCMNELYDSLPDWKKYGDATPSKLRYRVGNPSIGLSDSFVLHFMIRLMNPNHFIEVGSGWSSAVVLDTAEYYLNHHMDIRFIEPYPQLVYSLMKKKDHAENLVLSSKLQDVPMEFFEHLGENDILFIDSTHVSKFGSDVNYLFFHILPNLKKGVYVHLHDIFYPWQYPSSWIKKGMGWNELFLLRAFLQYNDSWEIIFFNHYMATEYPEKYHEQWKKVPDLGGGSFWMKKKK